MNRDLLLEIVKHIYSNLLIVKSDSLNLENSKSLSSKDYLLTTSLKFEIDNQIIDNKIWGCQLSAEDSELKMLTSHINQDNVYNYYLIVQLKNAPAYGVFLEIEDNQAVDAHLACLIKTNWLECNTYLQATFLAGMEQLKEVNYNWNKCQNYKNQIDLMKSFIDYHNNLYEQEECQEEEK